MKYQTKVEIPMILNQTNNNNGEVHNEYDPEIKRFLKLVIQNVLDGNDVLVSQKDKKLTCTVIKKEAHEKEN